MRTLLAFILLLALVTPGRASHPQDAYIHFPDLAHRAASGDVAGLREVLAKADTASPGEQLEELAAILSQAVRPHPAEFLQAQSTGTHCFGVDFMGPAYVDNEPAARRERELRRAALASISDPSLASARQRCLAVLEGG